MTAFQQSIKFKNRGVEEMTPRLDIYLSKENKFAFVDKSALNLRSFYKRKMFDTSKILSLTDIDQLITICGMIIRTSSLIPEMREAFFQCHVCKNTVSVEIERGRISEPTLCTNCNTNHSYQLIHNRSQFTDKQAVKLQEAPGMREYGMFDLAI